MKTIFILTDEIQKFINITERYLLDIIQDTFNKDPDKYLIETPPSFSEIDVANLAAIIINCGYADLVLICDINPSYMALHTQALPEIHAIRVDDIEDTETFSYNNYINCGVFDLKGAHHISNIISERESGLRLPNESNFGLYRSKRATIGARSLDQVFENMIASAERKDEDIFKSLNNNANILEDIIRFGRDSKPTFSQKCMRDWVIKYFELDEQAI